MRLAQGHIFPTTLAASPCPDANASLRRARDALARNDPAAALAAFDQALAARPGLALAQAGRLVCLARLGRADEVLDQLQADLHAGRTEALLELAERCIAQGRLTLVLDIVGVMVAHAPALGAQLLADKRLAPLRDHPVFLQMLGAF